VYICLPLNEYPHPLPQAPFFASETVKPHLNQTKQEDSSRDLTNKDRSVRKWEDSTIAGEDIAVHEADAQDGDVVWHEHVNEQE
jgi:hypothetical protein